MSRPWSLRRRLVGRVVAGACAAWLAGVALAATVIAHEMSELMDESLRASAELSLALYRGAGRIDAPPAGDMAVRILDGARMVTDAPWPALAADGGQDVPGWRVFRLTDAATGVVVETGQSGDWRQEELVESLGVLVVLMLPVLVLALVAVRGAVGSALRPATGFAQALRARSAHDLSPVDAPDLPAELIPIPQALNGYLAEIRTRIAAERQFAGNAAHELRTPLAAASGQAQLIAAGLADADAAGRLHQALSRMGTLVERLLHLSRAEGEAQPRGPCDLLTVARLVIAETAPDLPFDDAEATSVRVAVDPDALALVLRNLIRNAVDHGTGRVRVALRPGPALRIGNDVAPGAAFHHATFQKSARSQGAGLGLAIVARVARGQGMALAFDMTDTRAEVVLTLPPA